MTTTTDTKYNGWTNRSTWNVALWFGNDEPHYRAMIDKCRSLVSDGKVWTAELAEEFTKQRFSPWKCCEDKTPDGDSLAVVDWSAIANAWNEDVEWIKEDTQ